MSQDSSHTLNTVSSQAPNRLAFALRDWEEFLRSKTFRIGGIGVPIVTAMVLWFMVFYIPARTADDVNRWEYFQSELNRYQDEVTGKYAFELSEDRFVYYVDDSSGLGLAEAIRHEVLKRDIARFIEFINANPRPKWQSWFSTGTELDSVHVQLLRTHASSFEAEQFIDYYSINQGSSRSYELTTTDENFSWFVDGWNQNFEKILRQIPTMSFARHVEIIDPNEEWQQSGTISGYFHFSENGVSEFGQGNFLMYEPADYALASQTQIWYKNLSSDVVREHYRNNWYFRVSVSEALADGLSIVLGAEPETKVDYRPHETVELSRIVYSFVFILALLGGWCLLFFDRNLKRGTDSVPTHSRSVIDGRVYGMTLKLITVAVIWFVLLFFPCFGLVGSNPDLGEGALGLFFHPLYLLNWWLFFIIGTVTWGYISHYTSITRWLVALFPFFVGLFTMSTSSTLKLLSEEHIWVCFLPFFGPHAAAGQMIESLNPLLYLSIVFVSIVYLFGVRALFQFAEARGRAKGDVIFTYSNT